eukprot:CAMPEP_0172813824 /NCGR_PEP_ID=MMETSP1075-20121228/10892_1 /TAXON_ID=2916 /ORGANISM="Ceratium fusus, Strain PA161109" /LENGTH=47 /DNA_ID= /DNA_START= /DNA_END= /DNA_ORIENTATION=
MSAQASILSATASITLSAASNFGPWRSMKSSNASSTALKLASILSAA